MNEYTIRCLNCGWEGNPEDLLSETDSLDDRDFCCCPICNEKEFEDIEEEEY